MRSWPGPIHAPPRSIHVPSGRVWVNVRPPTLSRASSKATERPARCNRRAAVNPANPAPTTQKSTSDTTGSSPCATPAAKYSSAGPGSGELAEVSARVPTRSVHPQVHELADDVVEAGERERFLATVDFQRIE